MKVQRINKVTRLNKPMVKVQVVKATNLDPDLQAGKKVKIRAIPKNIKRAKHLFEVNKKYKIQEPPKNHINGPMGVFLKGADDKIYCVQFPYFIKVNN